MKSCDAVHFFKSISQLQAENSNLWVPLTNVEKVLTTLVAEKQINYSDAQAIKSNLNCKMTVHEYEGEAREYRDAEKAVVLANYYNDRNRVNDAAGPHDTLYWLLQAFMYLEGKDLSQFIDLDAYFRKIHEVKIAASFKTSVDVFKNNAVEILNAMARSKNLQSLTLSPYTNYTPEIAERIGHLLQKTTSIENVSLASTHAARGWESLNSITLDPIVEALKTNTSITDIDLSYMNIGDKGILKIIQALKSNPNSRVGTLRLYNCNMTGVSGEKILDMIDDNNTSLRYAFSEWFQNYRSRQPVHPLVFSSNHEQPCLDSTLSDNDNWRYVRSGSQMSSNLHTNISSTLRRDFGYLGEDGRYNDDCILQ